MAFFPHSEEPPDIGYGYQTWIVILKLAFCHFFNIFYMF